MIMGTGRSNLGERDGVWSRPRTSLQRRAADEGFDAAALAAVALGPSGNRTQALPPAMPW